MEDSERQILIDALRQSQQAFIKALDGVADTEAAWKPAPDCWSVLECAEHVAAVEGGMFRMVSNGTPITEPVPVDRDREERIRKGATDRKRKLDAPERARPRGRFGSVPEAVEYFVDGRERTIAYVELCSVDLRSFSTVHPVFGSITCQECLWLLIAHPVRHAEQIREIRGMAKEHC